MIRFSIKAWHTAFMALAFLSASRGICFSHPHVFITQQITAVFDDKGVAGFTMKWRFDEMFAAMIAQDYDKNQNGRLEITEVAMVQKEAFSYLAEFNYFTFIKIDGKPFDVKFVSDFSAVLDQGELIYTFFVPCHVRGIADFKRIIVATYDPSYYTAILFDKKNPAALKNHESFEVKTAVREDLSTLIYFDMVHPWALFLDFRTVP